MEKIWRFSYPSLLLMLPLYPLSADFVIDDVLISSPQMSMPDPEFDQIGYHTTWRDPQKRLWVADVDPDTGAVALMTRLQLDTDVHKGGHVLNGPEWAYGLGGSQIVYSKVIGSTPTLSRAIWNGSAWQTEQLENGQNRITPLGSVDPDDPAPRIVYYAFRTDLTPILEWRELADPSTAAIVRVGGADAGARWIPGERALVVPVTVDGLHQVFKYEVDTDVKEQLTFDANDKDQCHPWRAPELGGDVSIVCNLSQKRVVAFRYDGIAWTPYALIIPPSRRSISGAEPFTCNGVSYVTFFTYELGPPIASDVWIARVHPTAPEFRQISVDTVEATRNDPEPFFISTGPIVYYSEIVNNQWLLHRAATGLGPCDS